MAVAADAGKEQSMAGVSDMAEDQRDGQPDFATIPRARLEKMASAGREVMECYRVLSKVNLNVVGEILREQGTFYEWDHYPKGDIYDSETHSQYYYHAHRGATGEHGHFHTFLRKKGMPDGIKPIAHEGEVDWPEGDDVITHLIAISMDKHGYPTHLFTTNRWVTGENWFGADDVLRMVDHFEMDHAQPSWPTNRWLSAMLALFHPQIEHLLRLRDEAIADWSRQHQGSDVFEDRELEITSIMPISVDTQIEQIELALEKPGLS
ncbi:MAG: hypothetical protein MI806_31715 [Minwuiales bacterium]|nr:hypothetical protein [Minwuiales bacterium]